MPLNPVVAAHGGFVSQDLGIEASVAAEQGGGGIRRRELLALLFRGQSQKGRLARLRTKGSRGLDIWAPPLQTTQGPYVPLFHDAAEVEAR